jgi:hypothetical protein|tara:strand:+ start:808 stop:1023 length:216 start_codon:yes stop_codon:yes gene_type:complete
MIRKKQQPKEIIIDLTGPDGNAFSLIATAKRLARKIGLEQDEIALEMMEGDYENLIEVFDKHFGTFVILER